MVRFLGYFTILSNILVAAVAWTLVLLVALVLTVAWLAYTLVRGAATGFYPYPSLDVEDNGYAAVAVACAGVAVLFVALCALAWKWTGASGAPPAPGKGSLS